MATINEMSSTIKKVMAMYGVNLTPNEHGIDNEGFGIILGTELFKEIRGIGKTPPRPVPARTTPVATVPAPVAVAIPESVIVAAPESEHNARARVTTANKEKTA